MKRLEIFVILLTTIILMGCGEQKDNTVTEIESTVVISEEASAVEPFVTVSVPYEELESETGLKESNVAEKAKVKAYETVVEEVENKESRVAEEEVKGKDTEDVEEAERKETEAVEEAKRKEAEIAEEEKRKEDEAAAQASAGPSDNTGHSYFKGMPQDLAKQADDVASQIAAAIVSNPAYTTDLQRVKAAASTVAGYCSGAVYGNDSGKYYRSPVGVFITGQYTCAGSTRALGLILEKMGFVWSHAGEGQWAHQWNILVMDGQPGFADGMAGIAGYGEYYSGIVVDGITYTFQ